MPRRLTALILALFLTGGMTACGGGEETGDVVPRETPELATPGGGSTTLPAAAADEGADTTAPTDTTATTDTAAPDDGTAAPADPATQAPAAQAPAATTPGQSGGTAAPQTGGATQGGAGTGGTADPGGFSDFCTQNPGACDN